VGQHALTTLLGRARDFPVSLSGLISRSPASSVLPYRRSGFCSQCFCLLQCPVLSLAGCTQICIGSNLLFILSVRLGTVYTPAMWGQGLIRSLLDLTFSFTSFRDYFALTYAPGLFYLGLYPQDLGCFPHFFQAAVTTNPGVFISEWLHGESVSPLFATRDEHVARTPGSVSLLSAYELVEP